MRKFRANKIISLILALSLMLSMFTVNMFVSANAEPEIWDGSRTAPTGGSGTAIDPYKITNGAELAYVIASGGGANVYYKLTADIYLNDVDKINWSTGVVADGYTPNSWYEDWYIKNRLSGADFQGIIDGNGHVIYGLYYNEAPANYASYQAGAALIPKVLSGGDVSITNLGMDYVYVDDDSTAAAFVAVADGASVNIDSCYVGANATIKSANAGAFRGYGRNALGGSITNCYSFATTVGTNSSGLLAYIWETAGDQLLLANCYNANGPISTHDNPYYVASENNYESVAGALTEGVTTLTDAANMQGTDVFTSENKMPNLNSNNKYSATETYPVLKAFTGEAPEEPETPEEPEYEVWSGNETQPTETDEEGNILIGSAEELAYIVKNGGGAGKNYKLTTDIYLNYLNKVDWSTGSAIGSYHINSWYDSVEFQGNIDGDGFVVYGLYIKKNGTAGWGYTGQGLIPRVANGTSASITALGVDYAYVAGANGASAFVGFAGPAVYDETVAFANVNIDRCYVGENVTLKGNDVGAFRGGTLNSNTTITNSYSLATLEGKTTQGLIGNHWSVNVAVENSFNANGTITSDGYEWANIAANLKNVYATDAGNYTGEVKQITAENMQGYDALTNASKMSGLNADGAFYATEGYPVLRVFLAKTNPELLKVWDGASKTQPEGEGKEATPYLVSNGAELAWVISNCTAGEYIKLTADIYLNLLDKVNWATGEVNEGYMPNTWLTDVAFNGNIDGDVHSVHGVYYNASLTTDQMSEGWGTPAGLIPSVANGANVTIKNLGVDHMYINAKNTASAFVGAAGNSSANTDADRTTITIDQCFVGSHVDVTAFAAGVFRGFSKNNAMYIYNSYNLGKFRSNADKKSDIDAGTYDHRFSWFIANSWGTKNEIFIENCYNATGAIFKGDWTALHSQIINCYAAGLTQDKDGDGVAEEVWYSAAGNTPITEDNMKGKDVFSNSSKMPLLNSKGTYVARAGYPELKVFAGEATQMPDGVWDGYSTAKPIGKGTEQSPYLIATPAELAYVISTGGAADKYYKLTADIYLNDVSKIDWLTGEIAEDYAPNSWYNNIAFQGNIDGCGHVVYGLYYYDEQEGMTWGYNGKGLIPRVNVNTTVTIKRLGVDKSYISAQNGASAFVGFAGARSDAESIENMANVVLDQCYVGADVAVIGNQSGAFRGGAKGANTTITNCYSLAQITAIGANATNGLAANLWISYLIVKNSYNAAGPITSDDYMSGCFSFSGAYATDAGNYGDKVVVVPADKMQGTDVLKNVLKMPYLDVNNLFVATEGYPILRTFVKAQSGEGEGGETVQPTITIWDGKTRTEPTATDTDGSILVSDGAELAWVIENGGGADKTYKLTNDIYLNDVSKVNWATGEAVEGYTPNQWGQNESFEGTLNGNGFVVYGLYSKGNYESFEYGYWGQGLIPRVNNGTTANVIGLGVDNAYISGSNAASAFVGFAGPTSYDEAVEYATVNIDQCYVGEDVYMEAFCAGAFRGGNYKANTNITNSYSLGTVVSSEKGTDCFVGGLWFAGVTVYNSFNANGTLCYEWSSFTGGSNNYATGWDEDKTATGEGLVAYRAGKIDAANMQGFDVFTNSAKMPNLNTTGMYVATEGYPMLSVFAKRTRPELFKYWDGTTKIQPAGEGTEASPYLITNGAELAYAIASGGGADKYYKLTADIYLNELNKINWTTGEAAEGYTPKAWLNNVSFQGNIDGNGYVVYGLYFKAENENTAFGYMGEGLIPRVELGASVTVTALGIDYAFVTSPNGASAFVGAAGARSGGDDVSSRANVTIDRCFVGANATIKAHDAGAFRGTTYGSNTTITNSYSLATVNGASSSGLVGNLWGVTVVVENSFNANGPIANESYDWNNVGKNFKNVYATDNAMYNGEVKLLTLGQMQGLSALTNLAGLSSDVFVPVVGKVPAIKDFLKQTETKDDINYLGYTYSEFADYFTTADASEYFWRYSHIDVNGDEVMNICDLVYTTISYNGGYGGLDVDNDGEATQFDIDVLRKALIGDYDYEQQPVKPRPYNDNLTGTYNLVWSDEFNGNYLDATKWGVYSKMETNPELGYLNDKDENVIDVVDGNLKLTAYKDADGNYHSPTSVVTQNTMNFKYGYVEIRAKLPLQTGVWSSFWAKSVADASDVKSVVSTSNRVVAEVDIFEVFDRNRVCGNIIKWDPDVNEGETTSWYPTAMNSAQNVVPPDDGQFHIYAYEWTPTELKFYYDGVVYARFDITEPWLNPGEDGKGKDGYEYNIKDETGSDMSCYQDPQYLIFNNHLFYEGVSNANQHINISNPDFVSADYLIDYCRVYQLEGQGEIYTK